MSTLLNATGKGRNAMIAYRRLSGCATATRAVVTLGVIVLAARLGSSPPVHAQDYQKQLPTDEASQVELGLNDCG
jgi:hypothetical protein